MTETDDTTKDQAQSGGLLKAAETVRTTSFNKDTPLPEAEDSEREDSEDISSKEKKHEQYDPSAESGMDKKKSHFRSLRV